jgi:hypothetical protein
VPVPNYQPVPPPEGDEFPDKGEVINAPFAFGSKEAWYTFAGEQDGMEGIPFGRSVQIGDEQWQTYYDEGWKIGNYFRTMSGVNGYTI